MGLWLAALADGQWLAGEVAAHWSMWSHAAFFSVLAALALAAVVVLALSARPIRRALRRGTSRTSLSHHHALRSLKPEHSLLNPCGHLSPMPKTTLRRLPEGRPDRLPAVPIASPKIQEKSLNRPRGGRIFSVLLQNAKQRAHLPACFTICNKSGMRYLHSGISLGTFRGLARFQPRAERAYRT